jgi:chromosome segregation ATPase
LEVAWISKVELRGFKSFGREKVILPFSKGLTAIIGRNGSGKSNIVDAICFAFGGRSVKSMRGERYTDFIYSRGGRLLAPFAEVSLHINNQDGALSMGLRNVVITRRVDRTGRCVYRINGKRVDRQEVVDMLAPVMGSPDGFNFVMQGQIKKIFSMSSVERRQIIDQLAGISEYDEKREKTEKELQQVNSNLQTLGARLSEIERRVGELRAQAQAFIRSRELQTELQRVRGALLQKRARKLRRIAGKWERKLESERRKAEHWRTKAERKNRLAEEYEKRAERLRESQDKRIASGELSKIYAWENKFKVFSELLRKAERERTGLEEELERARSETSAGEGELSLAIVRLEGIREKLSSLALRLSRVESLEEARGVAAEIGAFLHEIDEVLKGVIFRISKDQLRTEDLEAAQRLLRLEAEIESLRRRERELRQEVERYERRLEKLSEQRSRLETLISRVGERFQEFWRKAVELRRSANVCFERALAAEAKKGGIESKRTEVRGELDRLEEEMKKINLDFTSLLRLDPQQLELREKQILHELRGLGEVNPRAARDLGEEETRLKEESEKFGKLEEEREILLRRLRELDEKKREVFMRVFNAVSENFSEIFSELSGGCSGRLILENPENPFEGGLGIEAEFDEASRTIRLSGGQQTLTAVALLLALQRYRPSTFYVMDEMDESLDPFNRRRVAELLRRYSQESQVVVVTLHNALAAVADRVFGVALEKEKGVSRVFSVELSGLGD